MARGCDNRNRGDAQERLRRKIGGGLWGYAFAVSLAAHLILWGVLAMPHDDAGVRWDNLAVTAPVAPELIKQVLGGAPASGAAADHSAVAGRLSPGGSTDAPAAPFDRDAAPAGGAALDAGGDRGCSAPDAGGPLENTRNQTRRLIDAVRLGGDETRPEVTLRPPSTGDEAEPAYIDGGGRVRRAATASSGATVALENEAMMASLRRDYKAAQEDGKPEAAAYAFWRLS